MRNDPGRRGLSYYPAECSAYGAGGGTVIVRNLNDRAVHHLPAFQIELFSSLVGCRPLSDHAQSLASFDDHSVTADSLYHLLERWVELGLLRPRTLLQPTIPGSSSRLIAACLSCDRPELLQRWIEERSRVAAFHWTGSPTLILDDTRDRPVRDRNRKTVAAHFSSFSGRLVYMDRDDRELYCRNLAHYGSSAGVPEEVVRFALLGEGVPEGIRTTGANRNTLLLLTAGNHVHSSDDDMGYRFARFQGIQDQPPSLTTRFSMPVDFFPDLDTMNTAIEGVENYDLIGSLQKALVQPIDLPEDLHSISPALARCLERGDARIRGVSAGCYGARHHVDPNRTLASRGEYRTELVGDENAFRMIRAYGHNVQHTDRFLLDGTGAHFPTGAIALDNSSLLAPFPPGAVHQDSCWIMLEHIISPASLCIHLPIAAYHDPLPKPPYTESDFRSVAVNLGMQTILFLQSFSRTLLTSDESSRLREVGDRFVELSRLRVGAFEEALRHLQMRHLQRKAERAERELAQYGGDPAWWAGDLRRFRDELLREIQAPESVVPRELRASGREKNDSLALVQEYYRNLGELLRWWPTIWQSAYRYNAEGHGPL